MNIEEALRTELVNAATTAGSRVYPSRLPPTPVYPALTYQKVSGVRTYTHGGADLLAEPRFQVTNWGESYSDAKILADEVRTALSGFSGTMGGAGGVFVGKSFLANEIDIIEEIPKVWKVIFDFMIGHE